MTLSRLTQGRSDKANSACHPARTGSLSCDEQEVVSLPHPHYTSEEIVQRGQALYDQQIRAKVEASHKGEFLILDVDTGEYEIDSNEVAAVKRAKAKNPGAALYILRVGYPTAYRVGGQRAVPPA
jgi:hypothetical protein